MLSEVQNFYVALLCDRQVREQFFQDPALLFSEYELSEEEKRWCRDLPLSAIERYAAGLLSKRWRSVKAVCPRSVKLWPTLEHVYREWLAENPAWCEESTLSVGELEGLRALPALRQRLCEDDSFPAYAADVLTLELLQSCSRHDGKIRTLRSEWDLQGWWKLELEEMATQTPPREPTEVRLESNRSRWRPWRREESTS